MTPENSPEFSSRTQNPDFPGVEDVSPTEVQSLKDQLALIDVRRPDEWVGELGHVKEAQLLTLDLLPQKVAELPKDKCIVFICRSGRRSAQAATFAKENGFANVFNMSGGMLAWNEANLEVVKD